MIKIVALILTVAYLAGVFFYADLDSATIKDLSLNNLGDFLAGVFAPLAFLWLVAGYFLQSKEIGQNTKALEQQEKALKLQAEELQASVEQQTLIAQATREQLKHLLDEAKRNYNKEKINAQPIFTIPRDACEPVKSNNGFIYNFEITNARNAISDVSISLMPEQLLDERWRLLSPAIFPNWGEDHIKPIEFIYSSDKTPTKGAALAIDIDFIDAIGEDSRVTFEGEIDNYGNLRNLRQVS